MDFFPSHFLAITVLILGLASWCYNQFTHKSKGMSMSTSPSPSPSPPEPAGAWPVVGHLHLLQGKVPPFRILGAMADKLGPVFAIRLGIHKALVVSNHEAAKQCFTTNDKALASRPVSAAARILGYNHALLALAPYGPLWREMRKLSTQELLSAGRVGDAAHVLVSELDAGVKDLCRIGKDIHYNWGVNDNQRKVVMSEWFEHLTFNVILRMIAGKRYFDNIVNGGEGGRSAIVTIKKFVTLVGAFVPSDVIPFLEWVDLQGHLSSMKRVAKDLDSLMESWVEEHIDRGDEDTTSRRRQDFIDVMLTKLEDAPLFGYSRNTIIKATAVTMILAGSATTAITCTWLLSALLNNRHIMKQAQEEIDKKVGKERWVELSDIQNLNYLQAIVKETLRLYAVAPLLVPHEAMEDCNVGGYHIPKGTRLLVNVWKMHRDPAIWSNPEEFLPERFLTSGSHANNIDVFGQHFELIPFGSGRRSCPGINLALQMLHLPIARLLQGFDMATPSNSPVDMTEGISLSIPKATPLEVMLTPRLPMELY